MKKKSQFISLIFLFSFLFFIILISFSQVRAATSTIYLSHVETLYPSYSAWYYEGRNAKQDFQNYTEGESPFYTTGAATVIQGIYNLNSTFLTDLVTTNTTNQTGNIDEKCYFMYPPAVTSSFYSYIDTMKPLQNASDLHITCILTQVVNATLWSGTDEYIYIRVKLVNYPVLRISPFLNASGYFEHVEYYNGGWINLAYFNYTSAGSNIYFLQQFIGIRVLATTSLNYQGFIQPLHNKTEIHPISYYFSGVMTGAFSDESMAMVRIVFRMQSIRGVSLIINAVTSNMFQEFAFYDWIYEVAQYVTKAVYSYAINQLFTVTIPAPTVYETSSYLDDIEIKSEIPSYDFYQFTCSVSGNNNTIDYTNINSYVSISSSLYTATSNKLTFNVFYKTKSLNSINNTIYVRVSRIYTPYDPGFMDLLLLVIPTILILIIPPGVTAIKFGRNGFLLMFFVMTLILTVVGMLPLYVGLLMLGILAVIFLKLMQQGSDEVD